MDNYSPKLIAVATYNMFLTL